MNGFVELKDLDFSDIQDQPADATFIAGDFATAPDLDIDIYLTKGTYRFTFDKPAKVIGLDKPVFDNITYINNNGDLITKTFSVDKITVNLSTNVCFVDVTILDNPIWLPLIYAAVFGIVFIVGALSTNSVLTKVETIVDNPTIKIGLFLVLGLLLWNAVAGTLK